jgi:hypothetical protein
VEKRDDTKGHGKGHGRHRSGVGNSASGHHGGNPFGKKGLPYPTKAKAGESDAKLCGRERGIKVLRGFQGETNAPPACLAHGTKLGVADFDEGKLGGHEKPVSKNKREYNDEFGNGSQEGAGSVHVRGLLLCVWTWTTSKYAGRLASGISDRAVVAALTVLFTKKNNHEITG